MPCPWERKPATQIKAAEVIERQYLPPLATDLQMESERNFPPVEMHLGLIFRSAKCFVFLLRNTGRKANSFVANLQPTTCKRDYWSDLM